MAVMTFWKGHWLAEHVFSRCFVFNLEEREIAWSFRKIQRPLSLGKSLFRKTIFFTIICNERLFSISLRRRYLFEKFEQFLIRSNFVSPSPFYFTFPKKNPKEKSQNLVTFWKINLNDDLFWRYLRKIRRPFQKHVVEWSWYFGKKSMIDEKKNKSFFYCLQ